MQYVGTTIYRTMDCKRNLVVQKQTIIDNYGISVLFIEFE